jgi:uncharacterized protein (DUF433 family)
MSFGGAMNDAAAIDIGIYTVPQARRLTGISGARIRRWLRGYEYGRSGARRQSSPVWHTQLAPADDQFVLGFLDLMEVRFVDAFLKAGLSLAKIRRAAQLAKELVGKDHPFSTQKFRTDGQRIFAQVETSGRDRKTFDLESAQFEIYDVIAPSLLKGVEFDAEGQAARWRPHQHDMPRVVLDPRHQFGQPMIDRGGPQTSVIADAVKAEGSIDVVAKWFEIDRDAVRQAVEFEIRLAA